MPTFHNSEFPQHSTLCKYTFYYSSPIPGEHNFDSKSQAFTWQAATSTADKMRFKVYHTSLVSTPLCVLVTQSCPTLCNPWTIACQIPLSMKFSRQEYRNVLPFPSLGNLPNPGIGPGSPELQADALPSELLEKPPLDLLDPLDLLLLIFEKYRRWNLCNRPCHQLLKLQRYYVTL